MTQTNNRIMVLPPGEARRIAAGEVVDRPAALVREFLDNAIDAGSANIEVSIEEGGCKKIEVADDGTGMSREDLEICCLTHATSKIRGLDDLDTALTLGFRGEALAAAAAVARLEIVCSTDGREAWLLQTGPGENYPPKFEQTRRTKGTTVRALNIFESIPARKRFLKREGSEGTLCRQAFVDKALAFPAINFRFVQDGKLKDFFPAVSSQKERFAAVLLRAGDINFLHEINVTGTGFSATVIIGDSELYRSDRRQMFVFANGRRVNDYSLIQAMDYGAQGWFPNGTHPIGAVYVEIDPALADFNIHPAKREVRFRDPGAIHHAVSGGLRNFFHNFFLRRNNSKSFHAEARSTQREFEIISHEDTEASPSFGRRRHEGVGESYKPTQQELVNFIDRKKDRNKIDEFTNYADTFVPSCLRVNSSSNEPRYAGRVFGLFILIEWESKLYIIDQHAAHERILYNKFLSQPIPKQELLAPIPFCTESENEDNFLQTKKEELRRLGINIKKDEDGGHGAWQIEALPSGWRMGDAATVKEILGLQVAGENMAERWAATLCCHEAIKDGDYPDDNTALALAKEALSLPDPRCPHGRPVWTEISKDALYKAVRRNS